LQGSWFGSALFVIPANAGIQKAQITTMVNPVQPLPDWIPAFAGMTGCGLSESDKNSGNGYGLILGHMSGRFFFARRPGEGRGPEIPRNARFNTLDSAFYLKVCTLCAAAVRNLVPRMCRRLIRAGTGPSGGPWYYTDSQK